MFADDTNLMLSAKTLTELKLALTPELNKTLRSEHFGVVVVD